MTRSTNIPYGSLATAMTQDPIERSRLGVWRTVGPVVATWSSSRDLT